MGVLLVLLGTLLVLLALLDAVITTLAAGSGGGPLTRRLGAWTWSLLRRGPTGFLPYAGPVVLLITLLTWVLLLWGGWLLVFSASDSAVLDAATERPADLAGRVYFSGFVVFTLGVGDLVPGDGAWQVAAGPGAHAPAPAARALRRDRRRDRERRRGRAAPAGAGGAARRGAARGRRGGVRGGSGAASGAAP